MDSSFNFQIDALRSLLADFYNVSGRQVGLFDAAGHVVLRYPEAMVPFCDYIQRTEEGRNRCEACDRTGCRMALNKGTLVTYPCHAGLREVCAPIRLEGETVGYLMFGHLPDGENREEAWKKVRDSATGRGPIGSGAGDSLASLRSAFDLLENEPMDYIRSLSNILESCVCYIQLRHLVNHRGVKMWNRVESYIDKHLQETVSLKDLAAIFDSSESTLTRCCREATGMTLGKWVQQRRLERACRLLDETEEPIGRIADRCGFDNYNYFSRWFRKEKGMTPGQYRKREQKNADFRA